MINVTLPYELVDAVVIAELQERYEELSGLEKTAIGKSFLQVLAYFMEEGEFNAYLMKLHQS